ncbi:KilA-N domain-containing protein [Xanthomonas theicola]|uniref:KilA-N domain-containing protein n=1 Tax=Xanthomonas theicola TaxID=56464 RepID=UPI000FF89E89|nr:KilA-N domain-containing protein [Xanthomonas theicola]QNH24812.1 KilA-N domain-containing protein [Xanthomonas theicola]
MSALTIAGTEIARDSAGRYSLNDLHRAAGGLPRHRPSRWVENQQTQALAAAAASEAGIPALVSQHGGAAPGTYVAEPLVIAYAAWISPRFHLQVLNTFLAAQRPAPAPAQDPLQLLADPAALRQLLLGYTEKVQALQDQVHHQAPKIQALDAPAAGTGWRTSRACCRACSFTRRPSCAIRTAWSTCASSEVRCSWSATLVERTPKPC